MLDMTGVEACVEFRVVFGGVPCWLCRDRDRQENSRDQFSVGLVPKWFRDWGNRWLAWLADLGNGEIVRYLKLVMCKPNIRSLQILVTAIVPIFCLCEYRVSFGCVEEFQFVNMAETERRKNLDFEALSSLGSSQYIQTKYPSNSLQYQLTLPNLSSQCQSTTLPHTPALLEHILHYILNHPFLPTMTSSLRWLRRLSLRWFRWLTWRCLWFPESTSKSSPWLLHRHARSLQRLSFLRSPFPNIPSPAS